MLREFFNACADLIWTFTSDHVYYLHLFAERLYFGWRYIAENGALSSGTKHTSVFVNAISCKG